MKKNNRLVSLGILNIIGSVFAILLSALLIINSIKMFRK